MGRSAWDIITATMNPVNIRFFSSSQPMPPVPTTSTRDPSIAFSNRHRSDMTPTPNNAHYTCASDVIIDKFEMERNDGAFTRLVEVLTHGYLQDGMPKTTATHLKHVSLVATVCWGEGVQELYPFSVWQAELRLCAVKQRYLEQQLVCAELVLALQMVTGQPAVMSVAGAELQHCLSLCPEETLLGVQPAHIRAADPTLAHLFTDISELGGPRPF